MGVKELIWGPEYKWEDLLDEPVKDVGFIQLNYIRKKPMTEYDITNWVRNFNETHPDLDIDEDDLRAIAIKEILNKEILGWVECTNEDDNGYSRGRLAIVLQDMVKYLKVNV
jgi:hypothetical protein